MPKVMILEEFQASKEQFELTMQAQWQLAKYINLKPGEKVRFYKEPTPEVVLAQTATERVQNMCAVWTEKMLLPELFGDEPIDFLHVSNNEDHWLFTPRANLFFRQRFVEDTPQ